MKDIAYDNNAETEEILTCSLPHLLQALTTTYHPHDMTVMYENLAIMFENRGWFRPVYYLYLVLEKH